MNIIDTWFRTSDGTAETAPTPRRKQRLGTTALLALALAGGTVGGGAVGSAITAQLIAPSTAQASIVTAQPIAQTTVAASANVAGAVLGSAGSSVVEITTTSQGGAGSRGRETGAIGSGFVIDAKGLILTNRHVINGATTISVQFTSGDKRTATVVGTDSTNDLAVLQVANMPTNVPAIALGDSDQVAVGDTAIAIGSPFGLEQTVTQGIISAVHRSWSEGGSTMTNLIQTDTPINPGNSGGPLLNAQGQVVAINTMIDSPVDGNVGVGFAVPINTAKQQLAQLEAGTNLAQGYLGVSLQDASDTDQTGVTISAVAPNSGAATAGLRAGDVITALNGNAINDYASLSAQITGKQPGDKVTVTIQRNGSARQFAVTLQAGTEQ